MDYDLKRESLSRELNSPSRSHLNWRLKRALRNGVSDRRPVDEVSGASSSFTVSTKFIFQHMDGKESTLRLKPGSCQGVVRSKRYCVWFAA